MEQIGKAVQVAENGLIHLRASLALPGVLSIPRQHHHRPLRPPADGAGHVERRAAGRAAGKDEGPKLGQGLLGLVDPPFHLLHAIGGKRPGIRLGAGAGQRRPEGKEVVLDPLEAPAGGVHLHRGERPAQDRVELVHRPVRIDPGVALAHPARPEEAGGAPVAGAGVDLHGS